MAPTSDQEQMETARAVWNEIATRARAVHCPQHFAQPWRVDVIGNTPAGLRLNVSGCCPQLGAAVTALIKADPRVGGPR